MHDYELNSLYRCTYVYPTVWFGQRTGPAEVRDIKRCQKGFFFSFSSISMGSRPARKMRRGGIG